MMDYYYYYFVYDQYFKEYLIQLSLHKLWQGEKLNVDLRRRVLVRNTLLTNNCLWIPQEDHYHHNNTTERMQEETWLDACINDLEEEEGQEEEQLSIKEDPFYINNQRHHNNNNNNNKLNQQEQNQQKPMVPITVEHQRSQHQKTIKNDNTCWRWHL